MNNVYLMTHKLLKRYLLAKLCFFLACVAFLLPSVAMAQITENPAFTVTGIEVNGQNVATASDIGFERIGKSSGPIKPLAVGDAIVTSNIKTPVNTTLSLRTLNGNTIRLMADSTLATSALHRAGERYELMNGTAEFEVTAPLGFFQVDNTKFVVAASDAKFRLKRTTRGGADEIEIEVLRGKASAHQLYELVIADTSQKPKIRMAAFLSAPGSLPTEAKTTLRFDLNKPVQMPFSTQADASAFFKNRIDEAINSTDAERIADALRSQAVFLSTIKEHRAAIPVVEAWQLIAEGNNIVQFDAQMRLANAYIALKEDGRAIPHLLVALKIITGPFSSGAYRGQTTIYTMLSEAYLRLNDQNSAKKYSNLLAGISQKFSSPTYIGPMLKSRGATEFPKKMRQWGLDGNVAVNGIITTEGNLEDIRVTRSIHPAFELAAVKGAMATQISAATMDGKPIPVYISIPFSFMLAPSSRSSLSEHAAFSFPKVNSSKPVASQYDIAPEILVVSLPAYPRELLTNHTTGNAKVSVVLDALGVVRDVAVVEASHPDFGAAAKAMMQNWEFAPAVKAGKPISVQFNFEHEFLFNQRDNGVSDETQQALRYLKSYPDEIYELTALDANPKALYRPDAADPRKTLANPATVDTVQIEFIIDREGSVQLPRIVSATNMDLAWSVATVLPRWLFDIPKVNGKAVFARKEMLFKFK